MPLPKRIVYVPGMISLIGLGILITLHYICEKQRAQLHVIELDYITSLTYCTGGDRASILDERKYIRVELTGNATEDSLTLKNAEPLLKSILNKTDKVHGIHYSFSSTAKYRTYINVINIFLKMKSDMFLLHRDGIWVTGGHWQELGSHRLSPSPYENDFLREYGIVCC